MTKEEKIKEVWIELLGIEKYNSLTGKIDDNGYYWKYLHDFVDNSNMDSKYQSYSGINGSTQVNTYRPISLRGIENNNGWIKIESEADLPKEDIYCNFINYKGDYHMTEFKVSECKIFSDLNTHYQPIQKPQPPLY